MSVMLKVVLSAAAGTIVGAYLEPKIIAHLPANLTGTGLASKAVHAGIAGVTAGGIFWVIKGA